MKRPHSTSSVGTEIGFNPWCAKPEDQLDPKPRQQPRTSPRAAKPPSTLSFDVAGFTPTLWRSRKDVLHPRFTGLDLHKDTLVGSGQACEVSLEIVGNSEILWHPNTG